MAQRLRCFDAIRGWSVVSMTLFHLCYDLKYLYAFRLEWFAPPFQDVWRASISWVFLLLAGIMCSMSRSNLRRGLKYGLVALAIYVITALAGVDDPISFGIIFCMAGSTLLFELLDRLHIAPTGYAAAGMLFVAFLLLLNVPSGSVGCAGLGFDLPRMLYSTPYLSWLGFPGPGFVSSDYYPLVPFALMYLCGSALGRAWKDEGTPQLLAGIRCSPLEFFGRHALPCYVLHQPLLLLVCMALTSLR